MSTKFFLIRHAQTPYSREKKYCGSLNPSLTKEGLCMAKALSRYFKPPHVSGAAMGQCLPPRWTKRQRVDFIYSSISQRTIETAKMIFGEKSSITVSDELREMDFGLWEGLSYEKVMSKYASVYSDWLNNPYNVTIPLGESLICVEKRVLRFFNRLVKIHKNKNIAVVSHFGPIRLILRYVLGESKTEFWKRKINLCSVHILKCESA